MPPMIFDKRRDIFLNSNMSGLCNRLRALNSLRVLAALWQVKLYLRWIPNPACPQLFSELFENLEDVELATSVPRDVASYNTAGVLGESYVKPGSDPRTIYQLSSLELPWETFWERYTNAVQDLRPVSGIQQRIDQFSANHDFDRCVGLHIRRTDLVPSVQRKHDRTPDDSRLMRQLTALIKHDPSILFYLATDNRQTQLSLKQHFPDRIVTAVAFSQTGTPPEHTHTAQRHTSVEDAVLDLYLLARCRAIFGTEFSSFSKYASVLGRIPLTALY